MDQRQALGEASRKLRSHQVEEPCDHGSGERQEERRRRQGMGDEAGLTGEVLAQSGEHVVLGQHEEALAEVLAEEHRLDSDPADEHRRYREQDERQRNHPGRLVEVLACVLVHALRAVKDEKVEAEAVQRGHEDPDDDAPIGEVVPRHLGKMHRLDDGVLGKRSRQSRGIR